jgi:membrane-bound lytic murein transglycosylase D
MKTMLKRKQKKAGYVAYGFLLLTTPAITAITQDASYSMDSGRYHFNESKVGFFNDTTQNEAVTIDSSNLLIVNKNNKAVAAQPTVHLNSQAAKFVKEYVKKNAFYLSKIKARSKESFTIMDSVFSSYNLPVQLKYLAVVESELKSKALSPVGAAGMWQLMPTTAKMLGLKVTKKYDERRLSYKSTKAAAKYLNSLYSQFGDWLLVIAAYNSGPGPVYTAIKKSGSRNFWRLQHYLPAETKMHVKRFIGTHYYFEGKGSITTLTKAEAADYTKAIVRFKEKLADGMEVTTVTSVQNNNVQLLQ